MLLPIAPNNMVLQTELRGVAEWKKLATYLLDDIDGDIVHAIEKSKHYDVDECQGEMIRRFMISGDVTWRKVIGSLQQAGYTNLAKDIQNKLSGDLSRLSSKG